MSNSAPYAWAVRSPTGEWFACQSQPQFIPPKGWSVIPLYVSPPGAAATPHGTTVAERVSAAQGEMASWTQERRDGVRLEGPPEPASPPAHAALAAGETKE